MSALVAKPRFILTRDADVKLSLVARANVAQDNHAQLRHSIHFNGFNSSAVTNHHCRATLIEFMDVPAVDQLLNTSANAAVVKDELAEAGAEAIMQESGL